MPLVTLNIVLAQLGKEVSRIGLPIQTLVSQVRQSIGQGYRESQVIVLGYTDAHVGIKVVVPRGDDVLGLHHKEGEKSIVRGDGLAV